MLHTYFSVRLIWPKTLERNTLKLTLWYYFEYSLLYSSTIQTLSILPFIHKIPAYAHVYA